MPLANPIRGQVAVRAGGRDLILSYSANAIVTLEDELDLTVDQIGQLLMSDGARVKDLRTVFWAGLQDHQPDLTLDDAGLLLTELTFQRAGELVSRAYVGAFPVAGHREDGEARPRKGRAAAGAGSPSTKPGRKSGSTRASSGG